MRHIIIVTVFVLLTACGGKGGGGTPVITTTAPAAPIIPVTPPASTVTVNPSTRYYIPGGPSTASVTVRGAPSGSRIELGAQSWPITNGGTAVIDMSRIDGSSAVLQVRNGATVVDAGRIFVLHQTSDGFPVVVKDLKATPGEARAVAMGESSTVVVANDAGEFLVYAREGDRVAIGGEAVTAQ